MEFNKLSIKAKKSWFIGRTITAIILLGIILGVKYFLKYQIKVQWINKYELYINIFVTIILIGLLLNIFIYPIFEYKQWRYIITEDKIDFSEGIYFIKRTIIPVSRIQHIKVNEGPINRFLKLADIEIVTAGGVHKIPNIELEQAERIGKYLNNKIKEKVEEND